MSNQLRMNPDTRMRRPSRWLPPKPAWMAVAAAVLLAACSGSGDDEPQLELGLSGLENLGTAAVYEGWLIVDGAPTSTGRFTVDDQGRLSKSTFALTRSQAVSSSSFVLTIEPAQGDAPEPAETHLLAGDLGGTSREATLSLGDAAALGTDFATASGSFFLATPTSESLDDEAQGIWWAEVSDGVPQPGLALPSLPKGWVYEGWVVVDGKPISTGRFSSGDGADSDAAGAAAGPLEAPPFPGQDFVVPATVLGGATAVISVEPEPDNSPAPFLLKPLAGPIGTATGPGNTQSVPNVATGPAGAQAHGKARIRR